MTVQVGVERVQGLEYEVQVGYRTLQMQLADVASSVTIYPALDGQDFTGELGTLVFKPRSQVSHFFWLWSIYCVNQLTQLGVC